MVALSSAEAGLYVLFKAICQAIGIQSMAKYFAIELKIPIHIDASAAVAISIGVGLSKFRHTDVQQLWAKDKSSSDTISARKVQVVRSLIIFQEMILQSISPHLDSNKDLTMQRQHLTLEFYEKISVDPSPHLFAQVLKGKNHRGNRYTHSTLRRQMGRHA